MNKPMKTLKVNNMVQLLGSFTVPSEDTNADQRRFEMLAYTGAAVDVGFGMPTVFDLAEMNIKDGKLAILLQHDPDRRVGFGEEIENDGNRLNIKGRFLDNDHANEVINDSKQGFPWQASVGLMPSNAQFIDDGVDCVINGQTFTGPLLKVGSVLRESSFVSLGADGNTSAVALSAADNFQSYELEVQMSSHDSKPNADSKGASPKELRTAFPDDLDFAFDCIEAGLTVEAAKAKYLDVIKAKTQKQLQAKEQELEAKLAAREAELKREIEAIRNERTPNPPVSIGAGSVSSDSVSASQKWKQLVQAETNRGLPRHKAVSIVAKNHGDLRKAMVLEANQGRRCYVPDGFQS